MLSAASHDMWSLDGLDQNNPLTLGFCAVSVGRGPLPDGERSLNTEVFSWVCEQLRTIKISSVEDEAETSPIAPTPKTYYARYISVKNSIT